MKTPELTVGAFILDRAGRLLLVVSPKWGYLYSIPGGHVNYGERIFDAVVREALEEVGLRVKPLKVIAIQEVLHPRHFKHAGKHFIFVDVLCKAVSDKVTVDGEEIVGYVWKKPSHALMLPMEQYTRRLVEFYMKHKVNATMFALND
ncbi:MAG: NUDIX domain-containing protein [Candidatus Caldarchaeum sp.]